VSGGRFYEYELRQGGSVVATGELAREEPLQVGERFSHGRVDVVVRDILPALGGRPPRLILEAVTR
jgi:hypothetical protein